MILFIKRKTIAKKLKIIRIFKSLFFPFLDLYSDQLKLIFLPLYKKPEHKNKKADSDLLFVSIIILRFDSGLLLQWCHFQTLR